MYLELKEKYINRVIYKNKLNIKFCHMLKTNCNKNNNM